MILMQSCNPVILLKDRRGTTSVVPPATHHPIDIIVCGLPATSLQPATMTRSTDDPTTTIGDAQTESDNSDNRSDADNQQQLDDLIHQVEGLNVKEPPEEEEHHVVAPEIRRAAKWISEAKRILVLSGAGVSCSAGIPDFRTPGTGLYDNLQKYNLPYPEAVFDVGFYRKNPRPFLNLAKELWPGLNHSPTLTHSFVSLLSKRNKLLRNYTQNIDGLEHLSLIQEEHLLECHGHFRTASCCRCGTAMEGEACKRIILETDKVPLCVKCNSYVKPDIVFFGQGLPERFHRQLPMDVAVADLLLVIGTSLQVAPVSLIPEYVRCKRILINRELVGDFDETTDAVVLGECDDICVELARQLDWETQLHELNQETRIQKSPTKKDANEETDRME